MLSLKNNFSFRRLVKRLLRPYPTLFILVYRFFGPSRTQKLLIDAQTDIVIEGFPRSANTFSVVAFTMSGNKAVNIAHHLHVEAQIIEGVRRRLPVMVLIREPKAAVRSLKLIYPNIDENDSIRDWFLFYSRLLPCRDAVTVARFSDVTHDFGQVVADFNLKFGTSFAVFEHSQENVDAVYREIDRINQVTPGGSDVYVARPSEHKRKAQDQAGFHFNPALVEKAERLYEEFTSDDD